MADEIGGLSALRKRLEGIRTRLATMRPALLRAGIVALKAAAERIDTGGPGWAPNLTRTPLLHKTGALLRSLTLGGASNVDEVGDVSITVGTNLDYARYLQEGTRSHGRGSPLAGLRQGPRQYFHGGTPARPYLFIDDQVATKVRSLFASYVTQGELGG